MSEYEDVREKPVETEIWIPVAAPRRFLGAPILCAVLADMTAGILSMGAMRFFDIGELVMLVAAPATHLMVLLVGIREPHLDTMLRAVMKQPRIPRKAQYAKSKDTVVRNVLYGN